MAPEANDPEHPPSEQNAEDEPNSWGHQVGVGAGLVLVSLFFFPEGLGAVRGEAGSFLYRDDAGGEDVFFGAVLIALSAAMFLGGVFFLVRALRKRSIERRESK